MSWISDPELWMTTLAAADLPPLHSPGGTVDGFRAALLTGRFGPVRLAELATPAGECVRDESIARPADRGLCQVYLGLSGSTWLEHAGRRIECTELDLAVVDPSLPLAVTTTATHYLTVLVPRHMLGIAEDDLDRLAGLKVSGAQGAGALLAPLVRAAMRSPDAFDEAEASRAGSAVAELVAALLSAHLPDQHPDRALRARIRSHIVAHLREPTLTPTTIAAAHHISPRRLHQLFRGEPRTVAALIRHSRLERCRADLVHGDAPIAQVSARWGFTDPAHFSRLFRAAYGDGPRDYRMMR